MVPYYIKNVPTLRCVQVRLGFSTFLLLESKMSGDEKYQEGDDICKSCTGLLIFTAERKKRGLRPLCVGVPGVAKGRVPKNRVLELNERTKGKLGTYVCFGYSQWTGMMERTGRAPLCLSGIHLNIVSRFAPKKVGDGQKDNNEQQGSGSSAPMKEKTGTAATAEESGGRKSKHSPIPGIFGTQSSIQQTAVSLSTAKTAQKNSENTSSSDTRLQVESAASEVTRLMKKGIVLQYRRMQDFYHNITTDPSKKIYKSAERIGASSMKVMSQLQKFWVEKFGE
jgi:hypothetical protein